jgi:hypothetical protein
MFEVRLSRREFGLEPEGRTVTQDTVSPDFAMHHFDESPANS